MKIAHLVTVFPPYRSGIGNACYQEVIGLAKLGHEVTVFTPDYGGAKLPLGDFPASIFYLKPFFKYGNAAMVPNILKELNHFDVIHIHYPFIGGIENFIFRKIKKPLIIRYHMDLSMPRFFSFFVRPYNLITKNIFKRANKILVSSYDYAEDSKFIGNFFRKQKEKFIELPYGVDVERFKPTVKNKGLMEKLHLTEDDKIILFVGGLDKAHYFKGIDTLLQATANTKIQNQKVKLIIVGKGSEKAKYEKLAEELKIKNEVIFTEASDQELPAYYNLADLFVLPSINCCESFGIVLLEAMACGKPCLASNLPGVRTVVDEAKTGFLIEPGNADDLAEKIKNIFENQILMKEMGEAGRKKVEEKYNQDKIIKEIEQIYVSLAKN
jgi:glycosyltransferase involved in cell wall biosynthesis